MKNIIYILFIGLFPIVGVSQNTIINIGGSADGNQYHEGTNIIPDVNNIVTIPSANGLPVITLDLSVLNNTDTDDQTLSFDGTNLSITDGNSVDISTLQDGTGTDDQTVDAFTSDFTAGNLSISLEDDAVAPSTVDISRYKIKLVKLIADGNNTLTIGSGFTDPNVFMLQEGQSVLIDDSNGDYTVSGDIITFNAGSIPNNGTELWVRYQ